MNKKNKIIQNLFGIKKPIIGMVHFKALPGSPLYEDKLGLEAILDSIKSDIISLQEGGIDAIMFGNENDRPYQKKVDPVTIATMSYMIGKVKSMISVPFGVDVLFDPIATLALAKATGASFAREVVTGLYFSDFGIWDTNCAEVLRYKDFIKANDIVLFYNICAEFSSIADNRSIEDIARSTVFSSLAEVLLVSGKITGEQVKISALEKVKKNVPNQVVFANTGVNLNNVSKILEIADGAIVGTSLKKNGITWNEVDKNRVSKLMEKVKEIRNKYN